jgi:hypothetical protein
VSGRRWSPSRGTQQSGQRGKSLPQWPCLLPSIAEAIAPLRNLTGDPEQQCLVEASLTALSPIYFAIVAASHSLKI